MIVRLLAMAALVLTLGPAPVATAAEHRIVAARDVAGDVRLLRDAGDLSVGQRQSIDIRVLKIDDLGGKVRFTAKLKRIVRSHRFDQMVFLRLVPRRGTAWTVDIGVSPQQRSLGYATIYRADGSFTSCEPRTEVRRPKQVSVRVPNRCLPAQAARVRLRTFTGVFRSDAPTHSKDALNLPGTHRLR